MKVTSRTDGGSAEWMEPGRRWMKGTSRGSRFQDARLQEGGIDFTIREAFGSLKSGFHFHDQEGFCSGRTLSRVGVLVGSFVVGRPRQVESVHSCHVGN
ncbi:hypothetical protein CDL15_Pgr013769 [Punica granatum]|nr:hypothetical protein CDL15_Pgr013769 [Punica granatum]